MISGSGSDQPPFMMTIYWILLSTVPKFPSETQIGSFGKAKNKKAFQLCDAEMVFSKFPWIPSKKKTMFQPARWLNTANRMRDVPWLFCTFQMYHHLCRKLVFVTAPTELSQQKKSLQDVGFPLRQSSVELSSTSTFAFSKNHSKQHRFRSVVKMLPKPPLSFFPSPE